MAITSVLTTDAYTRKIWSKKAWVQTMQLTVFGHMFNRGSVYFPQEFLGKDSKGDRVTFNYFGKMTSVPIGEGGALVGNEEALEIGAHSMSIGETRSALLIPISGIEPQRIMQDMEEVATKQLPRRASELVDAAVFQQLAGVTPTSLTLNGTIYATAADRLHVQGHNLPVAPSANRIVRAGGRANDQSLTSADTMTLALLDAALERVAVGDQPIEPFDDGTYDLYLSPFDVVNLKYDAGSAIQWFNIQTALMSGNQEDNVRNSYKNNMRCLGRYNNVNIYEAPRVANGTNSGTNALISTVRRNVLVGRDALSFASPYGGRISDTDVPMKIVEQLQDYDKKKGLGFEMVWGLRKMQPSGGKEDIGSIVLSTFATQHS